VNINLSRVTRLDFACATALSIQLNAFAASGKTVRLIRPNALVGGLLAGIELAAGVTVVKHSI
jgi:ABC-type transporter Mla MlaB component